jgi:myo-inositol-1(or 4)-monophosphatase
LDATWRDDELLAARAAEEAGRLARERLGRAAFVGAKAAPADLVTEVDRQLEAVVTAVLRAARPGCAIFGEESGGERGADRVWYVDPIDGTTNFVHGLPGFTVSVALTQGGVPVAGAVYDPVGDEMFTASRGGGATLNGRPIRVAAETDMARGLFATGVPPVEPARGFALRCLSAVTLRSRNVRNLGSAALHLCYVAAGRLTGFWEANLHAWDVSAAAVVVREAGGRVTDLEGREWHAGLRGVAAANPRVLEALLQVVQAQGPVPEPVG